MGYPFLKYKCDINFASYKVNLDKIKNAHPDYDFIVEQAVPLNYINAFILSQNKVRELLSDKYNEDIDVYTEEQLTNLLTSKGNISSLKKWFILIIEKKTNNIAGRLDVTITTNTSTLETLFVEEGHSNKGLGKWLVGSALLISELDAEVIVYKTNTDSSNTNALKLLRRFGFFYKLSIDSFMEQFNGSNDTDK